MKFRILRLLFIFASVAFALSSCRNEDNLIEPTCFDEVQNQGEIGIDCGGPCDECLPTCDDRVLNGTEQFIDCGGEDCAPCATCEDNIQNLRWVYDPNLTMADFNTNDSVGMAGGVLWRLIMEQGVDCGFPCDTFCVATCDDGIQNGDELGVDCGGLNCPFPCNPPTCGDGIQNGQETGIDCGAPGCPDCPMPTCNDGIQNIHIEYVEETLENPDGYIVVVEAGIDCDNDFQTSCPDCPIPTCFDGIQNQGEIGVDCGGPCVTPCDPTPSCGNGYQDGDETGVDCDDDPATACPPCATCADMIQNGPEFDIDCVDYPIPQYDGGGCPQCISCHDGIQNREELFELDVDCGGPNCESCEQFLVADVDGSPFVDQFFLNQQIATSNPDNPDTLFVPNALVVGPSVTFPQSSRSITGIQQIETENGTYQRILTIILPAFDNVEVGDEPIPVVAGGIGLPTPPSVTLQEGFIDGPLQGSVTYTSVINDYQPGDPDAEFSISYKEVILPQGYGYLKGEITFTRVENQFDPFNEGSFPISNISFQVEYNPYL